MERRTIEQKFFKPSVMIKKPEVKNQKDYYINII